MKANFNGFSIITACLLFSVSSHALAEQKINFKDEAVVKNLLFNKNWLCTVGDAHLGARATWKFETLEGNKVSGSLRMDACVGSATSGTSATVKDGTFKGKLKKDTLKFSAKPPLGGACTNFNGKLKFFYLDGTDLQAEGKYNRSEADGSGGLRGTIICYVEDV